MLLKPVHIPVASYTVQIRVVSFKLHYVDKRTIFYVKFHSKSHCGSMQLRDQLGWVRFLC